MSAEVTPNLGLLKPAQEDFYNVDDVNQNMDILDQVIAEQGRKIETAGVIVGDDDGRKYRWGKDEKGIYFEEIEMVRLYEQDIYSNYSGAVGGIGRAAAILQNYAGNLTGGAMMGILEDGQKLVDYVGRVVKAGANQAQSAAPQADMGIFRQAIPSGCRMTVQKPLPYVSIQRYCLSLCSSDSAY